MPTKIEKDEYRAAETTGHSWDGIEEYNNPLPRWWLCVLYASILFSVVYWILMPAIPGINGYTKGLLGYSSRLAVEERIAAARLREGGFREQIAEFEYTAIASDPQLSAFAAAGGRAAFADNCAPCHGLGGAGRPGGFPSLADDAWIWGGTPAAIEHTIRHGVRSDDPDTRFSEMMAFGRDGLLEPRQIDDVTQYVLSLSGRADDPAAATRGAPLFAEQCEACHGAAGRGMAEVGAPALDDSIWLYGDSAAAIRQQVHAPRHGVMPAWQGRLDPATIKMLTVYVHDSLGGGQ